MSAPTTIIPHDIAQASRDCQQSFTRCLSISSLMREEWAENRLADFNLWGAGVGASAHPLASLDRRLMSQPEAYEVVLGLLTMLRVMVDRCLEFCPRPPSPSCPPAKPIRIGTHEHSESRVASSDVISSPSEPPSSESTISLTHAMANVDALLDQLISVGFAIRKFGTSARLQKADRSFSPEDYGDLRQHLSLKLLVEQVKRQQKSLVTGKVKDANLRRFIQTLIIVDDTLDEQQRESNNWEGLNLSLLTAQLSSEQQHLVNANLRRRHRFVSARKHGEKLAQGIDTNPAEEEPGQPHRPDRPRTTRRAEAREAAGNSRPRSPGPISDTSVSAGPVPLTQEDLQARTPGPAATIVSTTTQKLALDYPQPPPVVASKVAKGFTCPCCLQTLPIDLAERNRWRKHISEDLAPYTCPFLLCPSPSILYKTKDAWKSHLFKDHSTAEYWDCIACNKSGQPLRRFDTVELFELHTSREHGDVITSTQLATLRKLSHHKSPPMLEACPLCYFRPADVDGKAGANDLLDHVSDHIHNFSLESLPWAQDGSRAIRDSPAVDAWLQEISDVITTDDGEEIHIPPPDDDHVSWLETLRANAETNAEIEEIFDRNGYFNEAGSQKTSNAQLDSDASIAESNTTSADGEGEQVPSGSSVELDDQEGDIVRDESNPARFDFSVARDNKFRNITHNIIYVAEEEKGNMLLSTVGRRPAASTLVFTRESERAEEISAFLSAHGHSAQTVSSKKRPAVESHWLVVVPDTLDWNAPLLSQAECVISYDCPTSVDQYIYRASQVNPASNMQLATTFFNDSDAKIASELVRILEKAGQAIPAFLQAPSQDQPTASGGRDAESRADKISYYTREIEKRDPRYKLRTGHEPQSDNTAEPGPGKSTLDPRYRLRTGHECQLFFVPGRVIAIIHHSSMGAQSKPPSQRSTILDPYGDPILTRPQRMVIVQSRQHYSICVPISTYGGRGVRNKRFTQNEEQAHAIIYAEGSEVPAPVEGEPNFEKRPIAVRLCRDQILSPFSRIHFGKLDTVEHNVKVMDIGRVSDESMPYFEAHYRQELLR